MAGRKPSGKPKKPAPKQGTIGRPTKKTPELVAALCKAIAEDCLLTRRACGLVGVDYRTMLRWQADDDDFQHTLSRAKAERSSKLTALALQGIPGLSNNAVQLLKWLDQEDAEAKAIRLQGDPDAPLRVSMNEKLDALSVDELRSLAASFKK
jgi:hypothetical protein